jgi:sugar phosphate isomerase/epimerase
MSWRGNRLSPFRIVRLALSTAAFALDRLETALAKVAWADFPAAEVAVDPFALPDEAVLRARLQAEELELAALATGRLPGEAFLAGNLPATLPALARTARMARALDAPVVVLGPVGPISPADLATALRVLEAGLAGLSVDLCLVHAPHSALATPQDFAALWARGVPARCAPALDAARAALAGWDAATASLPVPPRHVYVNDLRAGEVVPAGEGTLDLEPLAERLRGEGYRGALTVLLDGAEAWAVEPAARAAGEAAAGWFGAGIR